MRVAILINFKYPGHSAASNRVRLYNAGLSLAGVNALILSTSITGKNAILNKVISYFSPIYNFIKILQIKDSVDVLFVYKFGWISCIFIALAAKIKGMKIVMEMNEKPYTPYGNFFSELKLPKKLNIFLFQHLSLPLFHGFVVISTNLFLYVAKYKRSNAKTIKVPIIVNPEIDVNISNPAPKHLPYLLHTGSLSERKDGIIGLFEAFALANKQLNGKLHFYLTEKIAPKDVLESIADISRKHNLYSNIHFLGVISKDELKSYQQGCSMLILNKPDNEQNRYNFSTKLGEYLCLGKPVIYTPVGEMTNYLNDNENAFEVPTDNPVELANKILFVLNNKDKIKSITEKGRLLANTDFNYQLQGQRLKIFFESLLK